MEQAGEKFAIVLSDKINTSLVLYMAEKPTLKTLDPISFHNLHILANFVKQRKGPAAHNHANSTFVP